MSMRDFSKPNQAPHTPKIMGAPSADAQGHPVILDHTTGVENQPVEVRVHEETVIESDKVRSEKRAKGDPEVRIRSGSTQEWEEVKRGDD